MLSGANISSSQRMVVVLKAVVGPREQREIFSASTPRILRGAHPI
jgi:hypothetical protein